MLKSRLIKFLKIHPDETRMAGLVAMFFLCIQAGQGIGENAAFSLFLSSIDVDFLPYMYMGLGGVVFIATMAFSASLSRFQNSKVVINVLIGSALLFGIEWVVIILLKQPFSYPLLWLTTYGMGVVLGTLVWTAAGEVCDARQAKRLFPLFTSMGILGSVLGNLMTGVIANLIGAEGLILFYAALLGIGFILASVITRSYFKVEEDTDVSFSIVNDVRTGYDFVGNSQLFRLIAVSSILYSVLFFTVDFPFSERISDAFQNDAEGLAGFKGLFTSITTAVTFLVSLFLANRVYTKLGIVNSVLIMPITYVLAFAMFFVSFNFWGAVGAKFGQLVILGGLAGTAWTALFNVVPPERRGQVLAFNNGVPAQIGVVLSGVLIILSQNFLTTQNVLLLGAFVALITVVMTIRMRSAYGDALISALRAGRTEVFTAEDESFTGYKEDPSALQVILKTMQDSRPDTRRLAAQMLARMGSMMAVPDLVDRLYDDDASVRAAATRALADLDAKAAIREIVERLDDPDNFVREEALSALPKLGVDPSPDLILTLENMVKSRKKINVKAHAAAVLTYLGEGESVRGMLYRLLRNDNEKKRLIALDALEHICEYTGGQIPFSHKVLLAGLEDPNPIVRRETIHVFSLLKDVKSYDVILPSLADEDVGARRNASKLLKRVWPESRTGLIKILEEMNLRSLDAALDAIPPGDPGNLDVLREYVEREVSKIWYLRTLVNSFDEGGHVVALLAATLRHRASLSEERLIKAVGLFGNRQALDIVRKSLNSGDTSTRAAALEALETLGDPLITKEVLPILDRSGVFSSEEEQKMDIHVVIGGLLESEDYWLRAITTRVVAELALSDYLPKVRKMKSDPIPLVKDAAKTAIKKMNGGAKMKTLRTLSTLDRILLMREIPMFSGLSPEDLEKIAEVAVEQLFPRKSYICREGEHGDSLFIIVHGNVSVYKKTESGEQASLAVRKDGEFVGEMAILESPSIRSATLQADTDVRMLVLDGASFKSILRDRPAVAISVLQHMSRRVRELNDLVGATS